jgi:hypothetical protein
MLNVLMLSVVMLSVIVLAVVPPSTVCHQITAGKKIIEFRPRWCMVEAEYQTRSSLFEFESDFDFDEKISASTI